MLKAHLLLPLSVTSLRVATGIGPRVKRGEMPPAHRFASMAQPSEYTRPYFIESEDDVLHMWELPDFGKLDVPSPSLRSELSRLLYSELCSQRICSSHSTPAPAFLIYQSSSPCWERWVMHAPLDSRMLSYSSPS